MFIISYKSEPAAQASLCGKRLKYDFYNEAALYRAAMLDGYWEGMGQVYMKDQRGI